VIARRLSRVSLRGSRSSAVASRPRLLLADEPTSRLDSADALAVSVRLARESGAAVVCASHDRLVIEQADEQALEGRRYHRSVRRLGVTLAVGLALGGLGAAPAGARLSPVEQRWVKPLLTLYNDENAALTLVQSEERATGALVYGSGKNNKLLTATLIVFIACPQSVKAAGKPPSVRLVTFYSDLVDSCSHLSAGGNDVGKAIGEIRAGNGKGARAELVASLAELVQGSKLLAEAEKQLMVFGGKSVFAA
jgi:hypothetical protein